jgi:hypothetical protein
VSIRPLSTTIVATLLVVAGCGDRPTTNRAAEERASHAAVSAAMDASFDKETETGTAKKPAAAKPAAETNVVDKSKPGAKPKPAAEAKPVQGRPAWVDELPSESGKLFAVGGALKGRRDDARKKALQELASSLKVQVQSTTTINESEITKIGPGGERVGKAMSSYRNDARLTVDRELTFSRIVAEAEDGKESWALAELDRTAWAGKLRQEIGVVDGKLAGAKDTLAKAGTNLRAAAQALAIAGPLSGRRDALVSDLILAEPGTAPPACPVDLQALFATCAKGLASIVITLDGAPDAVFAARTMDAMARQGLAVNEKGGSVVLRLALRETPRQLPNGWTRIAVAGSATVIDPGNGMVAGSLQIDESASDPDAAQAKAKLLDKASSAIAKAIDEQLIALLGKSADTAGMAAPAPLARPAPAPAPMAAPAPAPAPVATAAPTAATVVAAGEHDKHFVYADEVFVDDQTFTGEGYHYVQLAKVKQAPTAESKGQGQYFPIVSGKEMWTSQAWTSRIATPADIVLGSTVIVFNDNNRDSVYQAPDDKKQARTGSWFICRVTDVSDLFKQQVTVAGHYTTSTANLRVAVPVK